MKKCFKWKNEKDSVSRHAFFMKAWRRYIDICKNKPAESRSHCGGELALLKTVQSNETSGLKNKDELVFKELWKWKEDNPKKKVPTDRVATKMVLMDDGSQQLKEGIWEKAGPAGVHRFERYVDFSITTSQMLDDGRTVISADQQDRLHDHAAQQLRVSKVLSLDDITKLDDISEEEPANDLEDETDDGTDDDAGELQEQQEDAPLFRLATGKPPAAQAPKVSNIHRNKISFDCMISVVYSLLVLTT